MAKGKKQGDGWRTDFDSTKFEREVKGRFRVGLAKAAAFLEDGLKRDLGRPGPTPRDKSPKKEAAKQARIAKAGETQRASLPGEPPRKREGTLLGSVASQPLKGGLVQRIGTPHEYGFWLEYGTRFMEARPWLLPGLRKRMKRIKSIVLKETKKATG